MIKEIVEHNAWMQRSVIRIFEKMSEINMYYGKRWSRYILKSCKNSIFVVRNKHVQICTRKMKGHEIQHGFLKMFH